MTSSSPSITHSTSATSQSKSQLTYDMKRPGTIFVLCIFGIAIIITTILLAHKKGHRRRSHLETSKEDGLPAYSHLDGAHDRTVIERGIVTPTRPVYRANMIYPDEEAQKMR